MAHCDKLHGKPTPPTRKVAPLKTSGGAQPKGELAAESSAASEDAAAGKANAKATAKKVSCIIPAKTAAATTLMLATAASIMQPSNSILHLAPDACLHVPADQYDKLDAVHCSFLSSSEDETSRFREM